MIRFACLHCSRLISVGDKHSGKRGRCPKCEGVVVVPERSTLIEFRCESCGHTIRFPDRFGGMKGKCPKCKNPVVVPSLRKEPPERIGTPSVACPMCGEAIDVPPDSSGEFAECPGCGSYVPTSSENIQAAPVESDASTPRRTEEDPYEEDTEGPGRTAGLARRRILVVSMVAAAVVAEFVFLVAVLRPPRPQRHSADAGENLTQPQLDRAQELVEQYIRLLESGRIDEAHQLHSPGFTEPGYRSHIEAASSLIGSSRIIEMACTGAHCRPHPEGDQIVLLYCLRCEKRQGAIAVSVIQIGQEQTVDGMAVLRRMGFSASAGPKTRDTLCTFTDAAVKGYRASVTRFFFRLCAAILVIALVQIVSMWMVFKRAGQPRWASIVPFYNMWVLAKVGNKPGWMGLAMSFLSLCRPIPRTGCDVLCSVRLAMGFSILFGLIPFVARLIGFVFWVIISVGVAKAFHRGVFFGIGLSFLPFVFYPILAFTIESSTTR